jgi:VanZ family protein
VWRRKSFRESASAHAREWWPAYLVLLTAIAVRLSILFSTALVPQTDGAYYLAQVQSLVSGGGLRFPDTPLLFRLQAFVAQGLTVLANLDQDSAIIWGVKLVDAVVPPLAALPVFALWLRWTPPQRRSTLAGITVAALPALSFGLVKMTGDLQKNAFALVFFSVLLLAFDTAARSTAARSSRARDWLAVGLALTGCALSHIGVFAAAVTFVLPALVTMAVVGDRALRVTPRRAGLIAAGVVLAGGAVYAGSLAIPKMATLWKALLSPLSLFEGANTFTRLATDAGSGGVADMTAVLLAWIPLVLILAVWRRTARDRAATATLVGAAVSAAVLSCPLLGGIDGLRLHLMAYLPAAAGVAWLAGSLPRPGTRMLCAILLLANALAVLPVIPQATRPTIAEPSYAELMSLRDRVGDSQGTVVVARHGLEWWAAWAFGSDAAVVPTVGATPSLWRRYNRVLLLQETKVPDDSAGPRRGGATAVEGATVIYEGEWYRLSEAPTVLQLGAWFEGEQRPGAAPRPGPR